MSEMVERVARAIYEEDDPWHKAWPWPDLNPEAQGGQDAVRKYREIARAAIEAMRTPTETMVNATIDADPEDGWSHDKRIRAMRAYDNMLSAALK